MITKKVVYISKLKRHREKSMVVNKVVYISKLKRHREKSMVANRVVYVSKLKRHREKSMISIRKFLIVRVYFYPVKMLHSELRLFIGKKKADKTEACFLCNPSLMRERLNSVEFTRLYHKRRNTGLLESYFNYFSHHTSTK